MQPGDLGGIAIKGGRNFSKEAAAVKISTGSELKHMIIDTVLCCSWL